MPKCILLENHIFLITFPLTLELNLYSDVTVTNRVYRKVSDIYSQIYATVNEITWLLQTM